MQKKLSLAQIKKYIYNPDYYEWNEFINTYEFDDKYDDFYLEFIMNFNNNKEYFLSSVIDLTGYLGFYNMYFFEKYYNLLETHNGFFVKDSVLHYFRKGDFFYTKEVVLKLENYYNRHLIYAKTNYVILKMILISFLIKYSQNIKDKDLENKYSNEYLKLLNKCRTWTSVYRSYQDSLNFIGLINIKNKIIQICENKNIKYNLKIQFD